MVGMVLVLIAVVVVAVVASLVFLRLRPRGGDLDSVRSYHSALGTLEHLSERNERPPVKVIGAPAGRHGAPVGPAAGSLGPGAQPVPPVPVRGNDEFPDPGAPLVFDDARPADRPPTRPAPDEPLPQRVDRAHRHALESMNHRPRRMTAVVLVAVVLVLVAGLAYAGSKRTRSTRHPSAASAPSGSTRPTPTSPSSAASDTTHRRGSTTAGRKEPAKKGPTTTTAPPTSIVASSTFGASATFPVTTDAYRLSLVASEPCWVLARSATSGATLWTGTVAAGGHQVIPATGVVTLEVGAPVASLEVDQVPVVLPTPFHTPFVATFEPAGAAAASGATTSTSSGTGATSTGGGAVTGTSG